MSQDEPEILGREGYLVLPGVISPEMAQFFWLYAQLRADSGQMQRHGDSLVPNTPWGYNEPAFEGLLEHLRPRIEAATGRKLFPTYSFFRIYKHGDVLPRHRDRPACEYSISLNIGQQDGAGWEIEIAGKTGTGAVLLSPGDAMLYLGCECEHWRGPYQGEKLVQVFLHYVDREGPHAAQKFDRRDGLMRPRGARPGAARGIDYFNL